MSSFLQSDGWELFQKSLGRKTWRTKGVLVIRHDLPLGFNYLYSPHPQFSGPGALENLSEVEKIAKSEKSIFLRIDPAAISLKLGSILNTKYTILDTRSVQPRKTVILDLQKSESELLRGMHEKTRYNIRLAEKRGVSVFLYTKESRKDLPDVFFKLLEETSRRDKFHLHERGYYEKLLATGSKNFINELFFAEYERKIVAAALVNFYKDKNPVATYLHGASSRGQKEVMAPHLLHWRIIQEAKERGFATYDFWGIDDKRWPGLTRFKKGFGGTTVEYPQSADIIYRPMRYKIYRFAKHIRNS